MATDLKTTIDLTVKAVERETGVGVGSTSSQIVHQIAAALSFANGTSASQMDVIHSGSLSISGASTLDCRGGLSSVLTGDAISLVEITWIVLYNKSSTSGEYITVGAGSNPVTSLWGASGDAIVVGPGGLLVIGSPIDGYGTTAGTADIVTITPATGTISVDYILIGRSA